MKDLILSKVSQEEIFRRYGGLDPYKRGKFSNPLRKDTNPSCSWYRQTYSGKLYMKDWTTNESIDCFEFVKRLYNLSYSQVLQLIAKDFNIIRNGKVTIQVKPKISVSEDTEDTNKWNGITFTLNNNFTDSELNYWNKYLITEDTLQKFRVFSVKSLYVDSRKVRYSSDNEPCFCYDYKDSNKFYSPYSKVKWLGSAKATDIIGEEQLGETSIKKIILTKSHKDVMVLSEFGIPAISLQGEGYRLSAKLKTKLLTLLQKHAVQEIIVLYDNDNAGTKATVNILAELNKMSKENNLEITLSYKFLDNTDSVKDISDFVANEVEKNSNRNYIQIAIAELLLERTFVYVGSNEN
jgi:5S rRNA maturation endonuclease (ribonuclease M5)